jgi:hypothetical protein
LAKFLQRKLETPSGTASLNPELVEAAVENAKAAVQGNLVSIFLCIPSDSNSLCHFVFTWLGFPTH